MTRACTLLHDLLADTAAASPGRTALVCDGQRLTYGQLLVRSNALAHTLVAAGVARGDRVLVFADNSVEAAIAFWGVLGANAIVSMIHPQTKADKLAYLLADSGARVLITHARLAHVFAEPARRASELAATIVIGDGAAISGLQVIDWDTAISRGHSPPPRRCIDLDLASIIYTSGSTGEPKGVMLTHANMLAAAASIGQYLAITRDDVILCALPFAFDYGLYQMILAFAAGARLVVERSFAFPAQVMRTVIEEGVTGFPGVPTMFAMLLELDAALDLSRVRYVTNTAAALPVKHIDAIRRLFPYAQLFSMYGLTECKRCTYLPPDQLDVRPDSVGIAIPNTELWLVDDRGHRVGPGEVGELVIRGATVMKGYWRKPEATARKLRPGPLPGEQVLYTGDLCRLDDEGYLYFVSRTDEIIKSRGEKIAPKEVEAAIVAIAGVREAAVVGVPDELLGSALKAFVVLEPGAHLDAGAIQRECRARLESYKVPSLVELRNELPHNSNGKVHKGAL